VDVFFETWCRCTVLARIPDLIICRFRIALKMRLEYASSRLKELNYVASQTYECTAMPVCVYLTQFCCCCCCWWWWWWCQWLDVMLVIVIVYIELVVLLRCLVTLHQTYQYDQEIERLTRWWNYQYLYPFTFTALWWESYMLQLMLFVVVSSLLQRCLSCH